MKETELIPTILRQLNNAKLALREYASIRDYLYIKDAVRAFKSAVFSDHRFDVYNVSTSRGYAVDEVVRIAAKALKKEGPAPEAGSGPAGAGKLVMSHARIKRDLGWEPRYDLDKGIGEVVRSRAQDKISGVKL
jgi:nucleoside-diphosphate-sugar epimerase